MVPELQTYTRELKKGYAFRLSNGDVIRRTYDNEERDGKSKTYYISKATNQQKIVSEFREVDDLMIAGQKHKFVPTPEEAEASRKHVAEKKRISEEMDISYSRAHVKTMLEGMTDKDKAAFLAAVKELETEEKVLEPTETKVIEPEETKDLKVCPDCGGKIQGRGFRHADDCPRKK